MVEYRFPEDFPAAFKLHPITGEKIELNGTTQQSNGEFFKRSKQTLPKFVQEKNAHLGITQNDAEMIELMGWRLNVVPTDDRGLVINSVFYQDVFFIFTMYVPWLAIGSPCKFDKQYFLDRKIAGPFINVFNDGFIVWARYGFGCFSTLDQVYYFFNNGTCYPLLQLITPAVLDFVPLYIDFDVTNQLNTVFNFYPFDQNNDNFHLAVTEFSRIGSGATPEGQNFNVKIEGSIPGVNASARVHFNPNDNSVQYVARWLGYNPLVHPLLNLRGAEIVNRDVVYVYLMQNLTTGLYGPKIELNLTEIV
ncbi:MAG: hypothetical protein GX922_06735 [Firmicutes bacterium]|jgi:hypothetical protein|nr:hypothetical protein [Bacillota bacterium]